jgi:hypothetical protein
MRPSMFVCLSVACFLGVYATYTTDVIFAQHWEFLVPTSGTNSCTTMGRDVVGAHCSATVTPDHILAKITYVMCHEDRLWNAGVLRKVHFSVSLNSRPIRQYVYVLTTYLYYSFLFRKFLLLHLSCLILITVPDNEVERTCDTEFICCRT